MADQIIPAQGTVLSGAEYQYLDTAPQKRGAVLYYLEDIDTSGRVTRHGPVEVKIRRQILGKENR